MNDVAHTDKKGIDTNEEGEVLATVANMEEYASREHYGKLIVWSRETGEHFSATPGDYFAAESAEALVDGLGEDMLLAYVTPELVEPIKLDGNEEDVPSLNDAQVIGLIRECIRQGRTNVEIGRVARKFVTAQG